MELPSDLVSKVKEVQETGADSGSIGWRMPWDSKVAERALMRTHTTATTFRNFYEGIEIPGKYFSIDRVFRNETLDRTHLAEFHQIEGFVAADNIGLKHLIGYLSEFYNKMGVKKLRFKPAYNPYTEPSMEVFAWNPNLKKWVEIANSGIFRPESLWPYGISANVVAWGLAVERLASLIYDIDDVRMLLGSDSDLNWIRNHKIPLLRW